MLLTLRYQKSAQRPACAAFLRGVEAAAWLREIGRWGLAASQLRCYLVPESIRSVRPAGLFVVVKDGSPLPADLLEPYGVVAERLYVPVQAALWPATTPAELADALLWPCQLLHPGIGLVGFDTADEVDLLTLLDCPPPRPTDWGRARPGPAPKPRLARVRVQVPAVAEVVESFQQEIGTVPLAELPGAAEAHPSLPQRALDWLRRALLTFSLALVRGLPATSLGAMGRAVGLVLLVLVAIVLVGGLVSQLGSGVGSGVGSGAIAPLVFLLLRLLQGLGRGAGGGAASRPAARRPGVLQRLEGWLGGRIHNLEQKRQNEIERLLRLFGENTEEALKYAIPLSGPYLNRGTAPQSAGLGRRATDFNLGGLGGGSQADVWDVGAYRHNLSVQYRAAATREIEAGRFKKAAYIYAHLLGDYQAAANALEQGGFYREAAALFKDHLRNLPAAAKCLEHGGLLLEAAELYIELKEHEKAGDLLQRLEQPELAARHYERGVQIFLDNDDRLAAARLLAGKLAAPTRAQVVLLQGWTSSKQPEVCLRQYFDLLAADPETDLSPHVQDIYRQHTAAEQRVPLLHVLSAVNEKHATPELRATSLEIAYEVVSAEAAAGNAGPLALLRNFLPADRLIAADCSRYTTRQPRPAADSRKAQPVTAVQLDATITWQSAVAHGHQWVALGTRDGRLHLARGNWYGNVEYYSWLTEVASAEIILLADEQHGNRILLRSSDALALETKTLPRNKYFPQSLLVECPTWLPAWPTRVAVLPNGATAAAEYRDSLIYTTVYSAAGKVEASFSLMPDNLDPATIEWDYTWPADLLYRNGMYHSYYGNQLISWSENRQSSRQEGMGSLAYSITFSTYTATVQALVATEEGLLLWQPASGNPALAQVAAFSMIFAEMKFVGPEYVATVIGYAPRKRTQAQLYHLRDKALHLVRTVEVQHSIVAILPTISRQQFALLEHTGHVSLHSIDHD